MLSIRIDSKRKELNTMKKNPGRKERRRQQFSKDREAIKRAARINTINQIKKARADEERAKKG